MNIYAPNTPSSSFWTEVTTVLKEYTCPLMVLGGDRNCYTDSTLAAEGHIMGHHWQKC